MTEESASQLLRIPVRIFPYGPPIWTASYGPTFHHNKITRVYGPNVFIENKAVKKGVKCNLMKFFFIKENVTSMMLNDFIDTMCLVKKMNLVTTHHRFIANITSIIAQFL